MKYARLEADTIQIQISLPWDASANVRRNPNRVPASMTSPLNFTSDDLGVEDAELWAVIDSAAAAASRSSSSNKSRKPVAPKSTSPPQPQSLFKSFTLVQSPQFTSKTNSPSYASTVSHDGQVLQVLQEPWSNRNKVARLNSYGGDEHRIIVATKPQPKKPIYSSPENTKVAGMKMYGDENRMMMANRTPPPPTTAYFSSPDSAQEISQESNRSPCVQQSHDGGEMRHSLSGRFPSVSLFKDYQNAAMAILEKTDYTIIAGSPFIKKSGWRKIAFYFNLSFEIKDKSIEFDENRNVQRAEFIVRAHMQGGRYSDGWGSCERREKRFMKPNQDIPSTAETRAKNRACQDLVGIGQYRSSTS